MLVAPSSSHAQNAAPANQDAGQAAAAPVNAPQRKKTELPDGDGKEIADKACHACHELTNLTHASKSLDDWRETVRNMIDNGADVPPDKVDTLAEYLAKNFGPKPDEPAPDAKASHGKAAALPDGDGKEIATNSCQSCHMLTNVTNAHKNLDEWRETVQLMIDRGADVPPDQLETLVHYLAKNFGPKEAAPGGDATSQSPVQHQ
jgi:cytochrome c5